MSSNILTWPACAPCVLVSHQCLEDRPGDEEEELRGQRQHLHPVGARVLERPREDVDAKGDHHQTRGEEYGKQRVIELEHGHQQHLARHDHLRKHEQSQLHLRAELAGAAPHTISQ